MADKWDKYLIPEEKEDKWDKYLIKEEEPKKTWTQQFSDILKRGAKDIGIGTGRMSENLFGKLSEIKPELAKSLGVEMPKQEKTDWSKAFNLPEEKQNIVDKLIQDIPELAGLFAVPEMSLGKAGAAIEKIPKLGKYLKPALEKTLPQAAFLGAAGEEDKLKSGLKGGATLLPFNLMSEAIGSASPTLRTLARAGLIGTGGALGGGIGYKAGQELGVHPYVSTALGGALGGLGMYMGGRQSPERIKEKLLETVKDYPQALERLEASKRLGLDYITPAEATGSKYIGKMEGRVGRTAQGAPELLKRAESREASETRAIDNLLETIFKPEEMSSKISNLYKDAYKESVPKSDMSEFKKNEIFKQALKDVNKSPAYREDLKGVSKNSVEYLDKIKEALYDMEESAGSREARKIGKLRRDLVSTMDEIAPSYKEARALAERKLAREDIEKFFDKRRMEGVPMNQLLKSKAGLEELQMHLRNVPEAQQQLKDMKLVFEKLIPSQSGRAAAALAGTSMSEERSGGKYLEKLLEEKIGRGKTDKAIVELITNPDWANELNNLNKISKKEELLSKFIDLIGKISASKLDQKEE
jgi:hypothetical protein